MTATTAARQPTQHSMLATMRRVMRAELMTNAPRCPHELPPPTALAAERALIGAMLEGSVKIPDLAPLRGPDFFFPIHRGALIALTSLDLEELPRSIPHVVCGLRAQGFKGTNQDLVEALVALVEDAPAVIDVPALVAEVLEASRRRSLLAALTQVSAGLRTGTLTADAALERLQEVSGGR